jgi:Zn finger protein HypA/HybF involved in hydrogenase expression
MSFWEEGWRKPIGKKARQELLEKRKGKCARCRKSFSTMRVKPVLHHTRKSNQLRSMQLLCPNCHTKAHVIKKTEGAWGGIKTVVKRKKVWRKKEEDSEEEKKKDKQTVHFGIPL